jgi:hypothetical protein
LAVSTVWARVYPPAIHQGFIGMDPSDSNDRQILRLQIRRRALQSRLLMIFAIGCTVMLTCCCVPMVVLQIAFGPTEFKKPADVDAVAKQIAPIAVPPGFTGALASTADNAAWRVIAQIRTHMSKPFLDAEDNGKLEEQMLQTLMNDLYPGLKNLNVKTTRTKVVLLRGTDVTFTIDEGEDLTSTTRRHQVFGKTITPDGALQLVLQVEDGFITDEAIDAMLDSMEDPEAKPIP